MLEHLDRRVFVEDGDSVDARQRLDDPPAIVDADDRSSRPLQAPDRVVAVEADDEAVPHRPGRLEQLDVPGVQQVEAAPRGDDAPTAARDPGSQLEGIAARARR